MYLILTPMPLQMISISCDKEVKTEDYEISYNPVFTSDLYKVSVALKTKGAKVYKMDSLTEVQDIEVTYQEIVKELT